MRSKTGFTLVEIIIVVAIILLLAAIAIPGILRSRLNANEAGAVASLKTISWAATTYRAQNPSYPVNLAGLASGVPAYVDSVLATGVKQGYQFNLSGDTNTYNVTAAPITPNITGVRTFFVDAGGVIRASADGAANETSVPIQ